MIFRILMAGGIAVLLAMSANAQTTATTGHAARPDPFRFFSDQELAKLSSGKGALTLSTLVNHENHYVLIAGRTGPGEAE